MAVITLEEIFLSSYAQNDWHLIWSLTVQDYRGQNRALCQNIAMSVSEFLYPYFQIKTIQKKLC